MIGEFIGALTALLDNARIFSAEQEKDRESAAILVERVADLTQAIANLRADELGGESPLSEHDSNELWRSCSELDSYNDAETRRILRSAVGDGAVQINRMIRESIGAPGAFGTNFLYSRNQVRDNRHVLLRLEGELRASAMKMRTRS